MAHFARIEKNIVTQIDCVANDAICDENGIEQESIGVELLKSIYGEDTEWVQTSYNGNFRGNFAGIGFVYDPIDDAFFVASPNCGHEELMLNDKKQWNCDNPQHAQIGE